MGAGPAEYPRARLSALPRLDRLDRGHGQNRRASNDLYAAGRFYGLPSKDGKHPQVTSLWKYDEAAEKLERIADLPKAAYAETGYPGFVATEDGVHVVYYSGHTYGETEAARTTKADIYLAKLNIGRDDLQP